MDGDRWQIARIKWYVKPRKRWAVLILAFQILVLAAIGIMKIRSFLGFSTWKILKSAAALSTCYSISGLAAVADSISVAGTIFIWLVNLVPQKECTVSMTKLYKWAYPYFGIIFMLTMILLLECIYEGNYSMVLTDMDVLIGLISFIGGFIGSIYIVRMCWTFVFDDRCLKRITHSYIIDKINVDKKEKIGLVDFWQRHLLKDCYNCLESDYRENLETILNESLTAGYNSDAFPEKSQQKGENMIPSCSDEEMEEAQISFFKEQTQIWNAILEEKELEGCRELLRLDVTRIEKELEGEVLPKFQLVGRMPWSKRYKRRSVQVGSGDRVPLGRIAWFFVILQRMEDNGDELLFSEMYTAAVEVCKGKENSVDRVFHQLLLIAYLYFSISKQPDRKAEIVQLWDYLTTPIELTEAQFDELLTLSAKMYAAANGWGYEHYKSKKNQISSDGYSEKNALCNGTISLQLRIVTEQQMDPEPERTLAGIGV